MQIEINGEQQFFQDGLKLSELLEQLKLTDKYVAVERNRELVPKYGFPETVLEDGDRLEIVTLVGGG